MASNLGLIVIECPFPFYALNEARKARISSHRIQSGIAQHGTMWPLSPAALEPREALSGSRKAM